MHGLIDLFVLLVRVTALIQTHCHSMSLLKALCHDMHEHNSPAPVLLHGLRLCALFEQPMDPSRVLMRFRALTGPSFETWVAIGWMLLAVATISSMVRSFVSLFVTILTNFLVQISREAPRTSYGLVLDPVCRIRH